MGCGDTKEKLENQMVKMKMERVEVQMERQNQLKLLKEIDGCEYKFKEIPDYIDNDYTASQETNRIRPIITSKKLRKCKTSLTKNGINNKYKGKKSTKKIKRKQTSKY